MSDALIPAGSSGFNLAEQGSIDWVSLSTSTLSFSVELLSRFSKAGVEMITVAVGQALFSKFNVPTDGQQRLGDAIAKLKAFSSYGKVLWFGFGVKHIVRTLCETEQGATCAAMCACLSVSYDLFFASKVLKELTDASMVPTSLTPALSQWGALINVCAGAVADSQFPILVEGFSRLITQTSSASVRRPLHEPTTAKALAGALRELSKVSNGSLRSVTFEGGVDCGWLAAVAQWLISLRVEIVDDSGVYLYSNFSRGDSYAQVIIIRHVVAFSETAEAKTVSRSYFVPPGSLCFRLRDNSALRDVQPVHIYSGGKSEWNSILRNTFGGAADKILHSGIRLAEFLCSGLRHTATKHTMDLLNPWGEAYLKNDYQWRQAFLSFAARRLPELSDAWQAAENNPERVYGYQSPDFTDNSFSKALIEICSCPNCSRGLPAQKAIFCLPRIGATLFGFLWILSWLDIDPSIKPSNTGLLILYYTSRFERENPEDLTILWLRGLGTTLTSLFTGSTFAENTSASASAICDGGICIFNASLQDPVNTPFQVVRQRVVLGHIERDGYLYRQVSDRLQRPDIFCDNVFLTKIPFKFGSCVKLRLVLEETLDSRSLVATFFIDTKVGSTQILDPLVLLEPHQWLNVRDRLHRSFGASALRNNILLRIGVANCAARLCSITSSRRVGETNVAWSGKCLQATSALWTDYEGTTECCPKQGEWVLRQETHPKITLLRGSYALLYSILCNLEIISLISLNYIGPCLICSTLNGPLTPVRPALNLDPAEPQSIAVCSMLDPIPSTFILMNSMDWINGLGVPSTGITTVETGESSSRESRLHVLAKKQALKQTLEHRGIFVKKSTTKWEMIKMLQDYDAKNPSATNDDDSEGGKDNDRHDVSMEDAL